MFGCLNRPLFNLDLTHKGFFNVGATIAPVVAVVLINTTQLWLHLNPLPPFLFSGISLCPTVGGALSKWGWPAKCWLR